MKKSIIQKNKVAKSKKKINQKIKSKKKIPSKKILSQSNIKKTVKNPQILEATQEKEIEFIIKTNPNLKVYIAGSFNNWNSTSHPLIEKKKGLYRISIMLSKGSYEYKYVINNVWCTDNFKPSIWNDMGSMNNILEVY